MVAGSESEPTDLRIVSLKFWIGNERRRARGGSFQPPTPPFSARQYGPSNLHAFRQRLERQFARAAGRRPVQEDARPRGDPTGGSRGEGAPDGVAGARRPRSARAAGLAIFTSPRGTNLATAVIFFASTTRCSQRSCNICCSNSGRVFVT
jgi:hypothetical protein